MANKYEKNPLPAKKQEEETLSNYKIKAKRVKVINEDSTFRGEMSTRDAIELAQDLDTDLVQICGGEVPTCKLIELSKFLFERKKKEKERLRQIRENTAEVKQVIIHIGIDSNDMARKLADVEKFLNAGDNVKFSLQLRGREMAYQKDAFRLVRECVEKLSDVATADAAPKLNGKSIDVLFRKKKEA